MQPSPRGLLRRMRASAPTFKSPAPPQVSSYYAGDASAADVGQRTCGGAAQLVAGMDIPGQWWTLFHSTALNQLVTKRCRSNPNTGGRAGGTARRRTKTPLRRGGTYFPGVQADYAFSRQRNPVGTLSPTLSSGASIFNLHTAQVSVSYVFDVFGANRRQVESLQAQADSQHFQLEATYLTLTANVVTAAIQEAALRAQIAASQRHRSQRARGGRDPGPSVRAWARSPGPTSWPRRRRWRPRRRHCRRCRSNSPSSAIC